MATVYTNVWRYYPGPAQWVGGVGGPLMATRGVDDEVEVGPDDNIFSSPGNQQERGDDTPA